MGLCTVGGTLVAPQKMVWQLEGQPRERLTTTFTVQLLCVHFSKGEFTHFELFFFFLYPQTLISLDPKISESAHVIGFFSPRIGDKQLPK